MIPVHPDEKKGEDRDADGHRHPTRRHRGVEEDDIKNDRAKNRQAEDGQNVQEHEQATDNLAKENSLS